MKRDKHQRKAYALRRLSKAVDRIIKATSSEEKARAKQWAKMWARAAGIKTS